MIGIATVASPDEDGIKNDRGKNKPYITIENPACPTSPSAISAQCRTVSVIWPLFMITVIPRAIPMINATPNRSRAPSTNVSVNSPSGILATKPIRIENRMNEAVISGNHHHRVGSPTPRSFQGITPYIITKKASPKRMRINL